PSNVALTRSLVRLEISDAGKHWFYIDNRGSVDGFDRTDQQPVLADLSHSHAMEAHRVRPVGRSRCEDTRKRIALVPPRVNLEYVASGLMQPRQQDDVITFGEPIKGRSSEGTDLQPGFGSPLRPLFGRFLARFEAGANYPDRAERADAPALRSGWFP